ncbi:hypothetical protein BH11MYX3_BH11MYX3_00090 [soil metagenome]
MKTGIAIGLTLLVGCADNERVEPPAATIDLHTAFGIATDLQPVGLAIAPDGQRYVFEESRGLYRLDGDHAVPVVSMSSLPSPDKPITLPFTDLVALGPNLFALTAIGDGFLLDIQQQTLRQHFCYLPGDGGGAPVSLTQRTDAIAYDAERGLLFAQPITYDAAGTFQYSQVATYDRTTGADTEWHQADNDVAATGMLALPDGRLVLGQSSQLTVYDRATDQSTALDDLHRFGVRSIDGLAIDPAAGTLVVVDKVTDTVFDIDLALLSL